MSLHRCRNRQPRQTAVGKQLACAPLRLCLTIHLAVYHHQRAVIADLAVARHRLDAARALVALPQHRNLRVAGADVALDVEGKDIVVASVAAQQQIGNRRRAVIGAANDQRAVRGKPRPHAISLGVSGEGVPGALSGLNLHLALFAGRFSRDADVADAQRLDDAFGNRRHVHIKGVKKRAGAVEQHRRAVAALQRQLLAVFGGLGVDLVNLAGEHHIIADTYRYSRTRHHHLRNPLCRKSQADAKIIGGDKQVGVNLVVRPAVVRLAADGEADLLIARRHTAPPRVAQSRANAAAD